MIRQSYTELTDGSLASLCLWRECRGGTELEKRGVAWTLKNRANHPSWWGKTLHDVILKPEQYSSFNSNDFNEKLWPQSDDHSWQECQGIVTAVFTGRDTDPTNGATHYFDSSIAAPAWAITMELTLDCTLTGGRLRFYRVAEREVKDTMAKETE